MLPDDPDSQARIFYLVLLGGVLVVWLFSQYRDRLGQAAQHAAIWVLIFVGAVLAVGFFEPLKQQLFNDEAQVVDENTLMFRGARDGHFYATLEINGKAVEFLIDTGASNLVLSREDAETVGIETADLNYWIRTQTANGESRSAPVNLRKVELGPFVDNDVPAAVAGGDLGTSLLGMSYLELYSAFRREGDRFYLTR